MPPRLHLHAHNVRLLPPARWPELPADELPPDPPPAQPAQALPETPARKRLRVVEQPWRPTRRGDCLPGGRNAQRPCPYATCRHSLLSSVDIDPETGKIVCEETREVDELPQTCALDIADLTDANGRSAILRGLEPYFGVTRERVRQLELRALARLRDQLAEGDGAALEQVLAALDRDARRAPRKTEE